MKKYILNFISLLVVFCTVFSFVSCDGKTPDEPENTEPLTSKSTTLAPVKIVEIPSGEDELAEMLNAAIEYVELYCYRYTKHTVCDVSSVSVGSLSTASNAVDAFKSIFGQKDVAFDYDYNASRDSFAANFPESGYTVDDIEIITAEQIDSSIVITANFPNENNPNDETGNLHKMSVDYINTDDVNKALAEFNSSASSVNVSVSDIKIKATINAQDSSLTKLEISYTERYSLSGVTLVKLEGSGVTGTAKTTVTYTNIGI